MKPRAIWTGHLKISLITVPIRVYTALNEADKISFNQLHKDCHQRLKQHLACPIHGKVEREQVVKGYFDLLYVGGQSIMGEPLFKRRAQLEEIVCGFQDAPIVISEAILTQGRDLFSATRKLGLEGIMAKSLDGRYTAGRRTVLWKKIKVRR